MMSLSVIILGGLCASLMLALITAVLVVWMQNRQESSRNPGHSRLSEPPPLPGAGSPNPPAPAEPGVAETDPAQSEAQASAMPSSDGDES